MGFDKRRYTLLNELSSIFDIYSPSFITNYYYKNILMNHTYNKQTKLDKSTFKILEKYIEEQLSIVI